MAGTRLFALRVTRSRARTSPESSAAIPLTPVFLTARGKVQKARHLGVQLAGIEVDLAIATRLARTQQTVQLALANRNVPLLIEPGLDEIDSGDWDGGPIEAYWDWERHHGSNERLSHGESVNEALLRYRDSLERLVSRARLQPLSVPHNRILAQKIE